MFLPRGRDGMLWESIRVMSRGEISCGQDLGMNIFSRRRKSLFSAIGVGLC
jgi:hypothetical protein